MDYPEHVETARLTLRRIEPGDAEAQLAIWSDPDVWAALRAGEDADPRATAERSHARQLRHWEQHGFGLWAVIPRGAGEPVGWAGAWYPDFVPAVRGEIEIGWTLRRPFWGHGYATEAARAAITHTFDRLAPARVISLIAPENDRSAAVAARLGMRQAGSGETEQGVTLRIFELWRPARRVAVGAVSPR